MNGCVNRCVGEDGGGFLDSGDVFNEMTTATAVLLTLPWKGWIEGTY